MKVRMPSPCGACELPLGRAMPLGHGKKGPRSGDLTMCERCHVVHAFAVEGGELVPKALTRETYEALPASNRDHLERMGARTVEDLRHGIAFQSPSEIIEKFSHASAFFERVMALASDEDTGISPWEIGLTAALILQYLERAPYDWSHRLFLDITATVTNTPWVKTPEVDSMVIAVPKGAVPLMGGERPKG